MTSPLILVTVGNIPKLAIIHGIWICCICFMNSNSEWTSIKQAEQGAWNRANFQVEGVCDSGLGFLCEQRDRNNEWAAAYERFVTLP